MFVFQVRDSLKVAPGITQQDAQSKEAKIAISKVPFKKGEEAGEIEKLYGLKDYNKNGNKGTAYYFVEIKDSFSDGVSRGYLVGPTSVQCGNYTAYFGMAGDRKFTTAENGEAIYFQHDWNFKSQLD